MDKKFVAYKTFFHFIKKMSVWVPFMLHYRGPYPFMKGFYLKISVPFSIHEQSARKYHFSFPSTDGS